MDFSGVYSIEMLLHTVNSPSSLWLTPRKWRAERVVSTRSIFACRRCQAVGDVAVVGRRYGADAGTPVTTTKGCSTVPGFLVLKTTRSTVHARRNCPTMHKSYNVWLLYYFSKKQNIAKFPLKSRKLFCRKKQCCNDVVYHQKPKFYQ